MNTFLKNTWLPRQDVELRYGRKVILYHPIDISYEIQCNDDVLAVAMAIDLAKKRYPEKDWSYIRYLVSAYTYVVMLPVNLSENMSICQ